MHHVDWLKLWNPHEDRHANRPIIHLRSCILPPARVARNIMWNICGKRLRLGSELYSIRHAGSAAHSRCFQKHVIVIDIWFLKSLTLLNGHKRRNLVCLPGSGMCRWWAINTAAWQHDIMWSRLSNVLSNPYSDVRLTVWAAEGSGPMPNISYSLTKNAHLLITEGQVNLSAFSREMQDSLESSSRKAHLIGLGEVSWNKSAVSLLCNTSLCLYFALP